MKYGLLVRKLNLIEDKFITSGKIKEYCSSLKVEYLDAVKYLIRHNYLYIIMRGIFYNPSLGERKYNSLGINYLEAIAKALEIKGVKNWYFGLETAMKLNNVTHEFFAVDYVVNDTVFRAKTINIFGHRIRFVKLKKELFSFGINKKKLPFSDIEKTVLDIIYLSKYDGLSDDEIKSKIIGIAKNCLRHKLLKYSKKYNKSIHKFVKGML